MKLTDWNNERFAIGDTVTVHPGFGDFRYLNGATGIITAIDNTDYPYRVKTRQGSVWFRESELSVA